MLAERSSAGNDNKRRVAKCAEPVLLQEEGRSQRVLKVRNKSSSPFAQLTFHVPEAVLFWQKQVAGEREREAAGRAGGLRLGAGE